MYIISDGGGTCENITGDVPFLVLVEENEKSITLHISDPTQKLTAATVNVADAGLQMAAEEKPIQLSLTRIIENKKSYGMLGKSRGGGNTA